MTEKFCRTKVKPQIAPANSAPISTVVRSLLQQYSQRLLIATVKLPRKDRLFPRGGGRRGVLNNHHLISTGVMVRAENQLSIREISSTEQ